MWCSLCFPVCSPLVWPGCDVMFTLLSSLFTSCVTRLWCDVHFAFQSVHLLCDQVVTWCSLCFSVCSPLPFTWFKCDQGIRRFIAPLVSGVWLTRFSVAVEPTCKILGNYLTDVYLTDRGPACKSWWQYVTDVWLKQVTLKGGGSGLDVLCWWVGWTVGRQWSAVAANTSPHSALSCIHHIMVTLWLAGGVSLFFPSLHTISNLQVQFTTKCTACSPVSFTVNSLYV